MKFEFFKPKTTDNQEKERGKAKEIFMKTGALLTFLATFNIAMGNQNSPEGGEDAHAKNTKIENNAALLNQIIPKIDQEGGSLRITDANAKSLEKEFASHNLNAISVEDGALVIHRHNKEKDAQTGETIETGITTFIDNDQDGRPDRVINNNDSRATEANAQVIGLQKDFSDFEMVSMLSQKKAESLIVLDFNEAGEAIIFDYTTGRQIPLNKEQAAGFIESATNGYNSTLQELAE